jgi:hypothetical protein
MNTFILLQICLVIHLTGLALMAGTTVSEYVTLKAFRKILSAGNEKAMSLLQLMKKLSVLLGLGVALLILSGTGMFIITGGAFIHQFWFKVKLILILVLILNGFLVGSRQELKLMTSINENGGRLNEQLSKAVSNLSTFYKIQMGIFFIIIVLSIFKFS